MGSTRVCQKCRQELPEEDFPRNGPHRRNRCKPCYAAQTNAHYYANKEAYRRKAAIWREANPDKRRSYEAARRASKLRATPPWANPCDTLHLYEEAKRLEEETGIPHNVDHIVPLQSDWVCGLHCADNLQVLPAKENFSKGNRYWPDQWEPED